MSPMNTGTIWIGDLDKAEVLAALYNRARPQGMGFLHYTPEDMTPEDAQGILSDGPWTYFDYLKGRVMKVDLGEDQLRTTLYNQDNGPMAAEQVIATIREKMNPITLSTMNEDGTWEDKTP